MEAVIVDVGMGNFGGGLRCPGGRVAAFVVTSPSQLAPAPLALSIDVEFEASFAEEGGNGTQVVEI